MLFFKAFKAISFPPSSFYFTNDTSWYQGHINYNATEWRYRYNPFGEREQKRMYRAEDQSSAYPWVYNLMGLNNMQYAVYHGYQTDDEYTQHYTFGFTQKPDIWKPVVFLYPAEYNIFTLGSSPKYTYKYRNNMWEKQYKIYDYLGSLKAVTEEDGTVLTRKSFLPYCEPLETELEPQSKGYIGKEKDKENNLGDHGVRKYDSQIGRFTSTEPLYEKYFGWSPYQYCGNNPVNASDGNGLRINYKTIENQKERDLVYNTIQFIKENSAFGRKLIEVAESSSYEIRLNLVSLIKAAGRTRIDLMEYNDKNELTVIPIELDLVMVNNRKEDTYQLKLIGTLIDEITHINQIDNAIKSDDLNNLINKWLQETNSYNPKTYIKHDKRESEIEANKNEKKVINEIKNN